MADEIRSTLSTVRDASALVKRSAERPAVLAANVGDAARFMRARSPATRSSDLRRWLDNIAANADAAARTLRGLGLKADRIASMAALAPDDPKLAPLVQVELADAEAAANAPDVARSSLSTAYQWAAMASKKSVVSNNRVAAGRMGRIGKDLADAYRQAGDAGPVADRQLTAVRDLLVAVNLPPTQPAPIPSVLTIRVEQVQVQEDGPGVAESIVFIVSRSNPFDSSCSVAWRLSGTATAADFAEGMANSGHLEWDASETQDQRIELVLSPDLIVERNETVVVTLLSPVGATLGRDAAAQASILDNDAAQPGVAVEYDENLPFGGLGIGTASLLGQPGNQKVYTESSIMIRCERSGTVDRISWQNRINGHGRTGYSDGDGGTISWICRVVPDPKAGTIHPGPVLGETRRIDGAGVSKGWTGEYQAAGGRGDAPVIFVEIPTIRFKEPFRVNRGDMLLFTQRQHGGGAVSINNNYSTCRTFSDWSPYAYHASCRQFKADSLSVRRPEHYPLILVGYDDGVVKGTGVMGYSAGLTQAQESIELGGNTRARQVFTVPDWADGRSIKRVISFWGRTTSVTNGSLRCRIRLAQGDGGDDEGQALADSVIMADKVAYRADIKNDSPAPLLRHNFDRPAVLRAGQTIYVVMEVVGGSTQYRGSRCVRWLSYPPVGLRNPDWALEGMEGQRDTGGGWKSLAVSDVVQDLPIWLEFG